MGVEMMFDDVVVVSVLLWAAEVFSQTAMKNGFKGEVGCTRSLFHAATSLHVALVALLRLNADMRHVHDFHTAAVEQVA